MLHVVLELEERPTPVYKTNLFQKQHMPVIHNNTEVESVYNFIEGWITLCSIQIQMMAREPQIEAEAACQIY